MLTTDDTWLKSPTGQTAFAYEQAGFGIGIVTKLDDSFSHSIEVGNDPTIWRVLKPIEDVVQEVQQMKDRFGVRKVFFIDSGFNVPMPHAKALCRTLIEEDLKVRWNSYLAPCPTPAMKRS